MLLKIGRKKIEVASFEEASRRFCETRDAFGFGSSRMPNGQVFDGEKQVGYVSYNGRVWPGSTYDAAAAPLYDNRGEQ
jgi:hypothetical protein